MKKTARKNKWHITVSHKPGFCDWMTNSCSALLRKKQMTSLGVLWQWFRSEIVIAYSLSYITTTQEVCGEFHEVKDINFVSVRRHYQFTSQPLITGLDVISNDNRSTPAKRARVILCIICQCICRVRVQIQYSILSTLPNKAHQHPMSEMYCWVTTVAKDFTELIQYKINSKQICQCI